MSRNIQHLALIITLAFAALIAYLTYWQIVAADEMVAQMPYNAPRAQAAEEMVTRGAILDRAGNPLAWSEQSPQGSQRVFAEPSLVHVVGYHSYRFGTANVEDEFNEYLRAEKGLDPVTLLRKNFLRQPVSGAEVTTTIDFELQRVADEVLGDWPGAIVALNPRTGEILALASHPYFDPNRLEEDWELIVDDPGRPLVNRASGGHYVPGSTFKIVTLAVALDAGVATPQMTFENTGDLVVDGFRIKYTNPPNLPTFDLRDAFAFSVNAAFAEIGLQLGANRLAQGAEQFGFGDAVPLEGIPTTASQVAGSAGSLRSRPTLASTAFGQGEITASPLQMALVTAAIANDGVMPHPYVVAEVKDSAGRVIYQNSPRPWQRAMTSETARILNDMMVYSVEQGFAQPARISGVQVGGKTGTAETVADAEPHAWFVGYAPADDPTIVVAVIRENAGPGSQEATPQARQVLQAWLNRR